MLNLIKKLSLYFILVNLFFLGIRLIYGQEVIIDIESPKSNFIQVFIKKNGKYTEKNSWRAELVRTGEVRFNLPFGSFEDNVIRILQILKGMFLSIKLL
jgi:hypothetical protein